LTLPESTVTQYTPAATSAFNRAASGVRSLFLLENPVDTLKFGLSLYVMTYVGACFNLLTLVILSWIAIFTGPRLYISHHALLDELAGKAAGKVNQVKVKVMESLPGNIMPKTVVSSKEE